MLSAVALRSKGHWGYDAAFLEASRAELTLDANQAAQTVVAAVGAGRAGRWAGFHLLVAGTEPALAGACLEMLFVDPPFIGQGVGRALLADAVATAAARGWRSLRIESDPGAEPFYLAHGARHIGAVASGSVAGRSLPLLELPIRAW